MIVSARNFLRTLFPAAALAAVLSFGTLTVSPVEAGFIAKWHFNDLSANTDYAGPIAADIAASGVIVGGLTRGDGIDPFQTRTVGGQNVMRFRNDVGANSKALALSGGTYGEFSLKAQTGYSLNLTGFEIKAMSANGAPNFQPRTYFVRYSTDDFASFNEIITDTTVPGTGLSPNSVALSLSNLTSTIKFRIYGYNGPTGTNSVDRGLQYDDITVIGTAVPEPGSLSLLAVGLVGLVGIRRHRS
jgi:hypothetical protein